MARNNIGSLVVLKPGEQHHIAGILTERGKIVFEKSRLCYQLRVLNQIICISETDYLRKVIVQDRSSKQTEVGEIMTNQVN